MDPISRAHQLLARTDDTIGERHSPGFDYDEWEARMPNVSDGRALAAWANEPPEIEITAQGAAPVMFRTNPNAARAPSPKEAPALSREAIDVIAQTLAAERKGMREFVAKELAPLREKVEQLRQEIEQLHAAARATTPLPRRPGIKRNVSAASH